ncbi:MAG TPA: PQQ-binding-like beta-propeller repeat protein [Gemmatimonadales bacterium]|nr:PQQ-binding-like beta-propeller repeat protein [Gemmatimonadales bacterium]
MARYQRLLTSLILCGSVACSADAPRLSIRPVTETTLRGAGEDPTGWYTHGRDWSNSRYTPLAEIDTLNVASLQPLWRHDLKLYFRRSTRNESTPLVVDDLLIYTDLKNLVLAVDVRTGAERWRYQPELGPVALCCGMVNRGVAAYGDKVYVATLDARLIALRRSDGSVAWDVRVAEPSKGYSFTMAPLAAAGSIIVGASGGEFGIRGFLDAYDPETGRRVWRFWTVPSPEEGGWWGRWSTTTPHGEPLTRDIPGEKRDSAKYAEAWRRGGAAVWSTPAYDPALGLLYFGTGEPSAVDGVIPPGDNLYSTSLLAVEAATGRLRWYHQMVPHSRWNLDACSPPVLVDATEGDSTVPAVAHAGKTGWVYVFDRRTGRLIRRSEPLVPLENIFPVPTAQGTRASPGVFGGSSWPPPAYLPATGLLYVPASYMPMRFVTGKPGDPGKAHDVFRNAHFERLDDTLRFGVLSAIEVGTGRVRWQNRVRRHLMYGGVLATGGGLVFIGGPQGLTAIDAVTGRTLWRGQAGRAPVGPPISFTVDGRQRIAVTSQSGVTVFGLPERRGTF